MTGFLPSSLTTPQQPQGTNALAALQQVNPSAAYQGFNPSGGSKNSPALVAALLDAQNAAQGNTDQGSGASGAGFGDGGGTQMAGGGFGGGSTGFG